MQPAKNVTGLTTLDHPKYLGGLPLEAVFTCRNFGDGFLFCRLLDTKFPTVNPLNPTAFPQSVLF
jgi:hypothetical protein